MDVGDAIRRRASTRAFLDRAIEPGQVSALLEVARWAPSGVNAQPWHVAVVTGSRKRALSQAIVEARNAGAPETPDYQYYPTEWIEPYRTRRFRCGMALYGALRIGRDDQKERKAAWERNYDFFGAPVGLLFFLDKRLAKGSWVDMGMFIQNVMLAALEQGLATCPQASLAEHPALVREVLEIPEQLALVCGMALGYPDPSAAVNNYRTDREPVDTFTRWYE